MPTQYTIDDLNGRKVKRRNMTNAKPYRTKAQKAEAKRTARKGKDGAYRSGADVSFHPVVPLDRQERADG